MFFLLWIVLNGKITLELILFGIAISCGICFFAWKVMGYSVKMEWKMIRNIHWVLFYVLTLVWEILKAAVAVAREVLRPHKQLTPVIIEFNVDLGSDIKNVLLANSITLTPGTYTLFEDDGHFVVHCLKKEFAEGMEDSVFVKILKKMK